MIEQELIRFIKDKSAEIGKRLKVPVIITTEIDPNYNKCSAYYFNRKIRIGLKCLYQFQDKNCHKETVPSDNFFNRVYFIIAHETAHFLQRYKFPKWHITYLAKWRSNLPIKDYADQKLEKNASKIASILLKEYKKEEENDKQI